jgi:phosphohistidine phosphatase
MKKVFFIRHAKSSWDDFSLQDIDRPLNKRGLRDAPFMATMLTGKGVKPDAIISSPANRAYTTATYFASAASIDNQSIIKNIDIYEAMSITVKEIVNNLNNDWDTVLIFGHNPTFTSLANSYHEEYIPNVPTCGIVEVEADIDDWKKFNEETGKRKNFYFPKQYFT